MNIQELQQAYERGEPLVPDSVYDQLNTDNEPIGPSGTTKHFQRMYSLKKVYNMDKAPIPANKCVKTPKLDGVAVGLCYVYGRFYRAVTRGDGEYGIDVTKTVRHLVPEELAVRDLAVLQVTGEIVCKDKELANARNIAAGAINLKSDAEFQQRVKEHTIQFIPYDCNLFPGNDWQQGMLDLFPVSVLTIDEKEYPTDGYVFRLSDLNECSKLGYTHKEPKWAFAFKEKGEQKQTVVRAVNWQLGKGGKVTPVVEFDTVVIDGADIRRATLHNAKYVEDIELNIGDTIIVERSGGIIPHVVAKV